MKSIPVKLASVFVIIVGLGMVTQWSMSLATGQVPEVQTEPIRIWFHIAAEMVCALILVSGGIGLLRERLWAPTVHRVSIGMLLYTSIVSPGYFAQQGSWVWLVVFGVIIVLSLTGLRALGATRLT